MFERPEWHDVALCRGDGPDVWMLSQGHNPHAEALRSICRRCPVAVDCLIDGLAEPSEERNVGPMRCSVSGGRPWGLVRRLVDELGPVDRADWEMFTSMILDEDMVEQERRSSPRSRADKGAPADRRRRVVELTAAGFPLRDVAVEVGVHLSTAYGYLRAG